MATGINPAEVEQVLGALLVPNSNTIQEAEKRLRKIGKDPTSVPAYIQVLRQSQNPGVRQLAGVILRKRVVPLWSRIPEEAQQQVKSQLLEAIIHEPIALVRKSTAMVVSSIAKFTVPTGQWPELLQFLAQCQQSSDATHREVALQTLGSMLESIGDKLKAQFGDDHIQAALDAGLKDAEASVQMTAVRATGSWAQWAQSAQDVQRFEALLQPMLQALCKCMADDRWQQHILDAFDVFDDLIDSLSSRTARCIVPIVTFIIQCLTTGLSTTPAATKRRCLGFLDSLIETKVKILTRHKLVQTVLEAILNVMATYKGEDPDEDGGDDDDDNDDEEDDDDTTSNEPIHVVAAHVLDSLARHISSKLIFPTIMTFVKQAIGSGDPFALRAALLALAAVSEGCSELLRPVLNDILPIVCSAVRDATHRTIRGAACITIANFAEYLQPEVLDYDEHLLPLLVQTMGDRSISVRRRSCYALELLVENMETDALEAYLDPILKALVPLIQQVSAQAGSLSSDQCSMCESALTTLSSIAASGGDAFAAKYYGDCLSLLMPFLTAGMPLDARTLPLRARATECMGVVVSAGGVQRLLPNAQTLMDAVCGCNLSVESAGNEQFNELREYTFIFLAHVSECLNDQFPVDRYLEGVLTAIWRSIDSSDGIVAERVTVSKYNDGSSAAFAQGGDDDEDDDEEEDFGHQFSVRTSFLDEKVAALFLLGDLFHYLPAAAMVGAVERSAEKLETMMGHFYDDVRRQALNCSHWMVHCAVKTFGADSAQVQQLLNKYVPEYIRTLAEEEDKTVVASVCEVFDHLFSAESINVGHILKADGDVISALCTALLQILSGEAPCIAGYDDDEEEEEDYEDEDIDDVGEGTGAEEVRDGVGDVLMAMAKFFRTEFAALWGPFSEALLPFCGESRSTADRVMGIGVFGEALHCMGPAVTEASVDVLLPIAVKGMQAKDAGIRHNAVFLTGVLLEHGAAKVGANVLPQLLQVFQTLLGAQKHGVVVDNTLSAISKMLRAYKQQVPMLEAVVDGFLGLLPLRSDIAEYESIMLGLRCIVTDIVPTPSAPTTEDAAALAASMPGRVFSATLKSLVQHDAVMSETAKSTAAQVLAVCRAALTVAWVESVVAEFPEASRPSAKMYALM